MVQLARLDAIDGMPLFSNENIANIVGVSKKSVLRVLQTFQTTGGVIGRIRRTGGKQQILNDDHRQVCLFFCL